MVKVNAIKKLRWLQLNEKEVLVFDIEFTTNVFLPNYIELGKNVIIGFGMVKQKKTHKLITIKIKYVIKYI